MRERWLVLGVCGLALVAAWGTKAHCFTDGVWVDGEAYTRWCYTDVVPLWHAERLDEGALPYRDHPVEYPVLTGVQMEVAARVVRVLPVTEGPVAFFHVTALLGAAAGLAVLWLLARQGVPRGRLLWWAAAPTLVVSAFLNWDLVPIALLVGGIGLHREGRDGWAGALAGLGTAAKLFPALLVPVVVAARLRQGRPRAALLHAGTAAGAWAAVNVPVLLAWPESWWRFAELNRQRGADWDTLWFLAERLRGASLDVGVLNLASAAVFLIGAATIAFIGSRERAPEEWWRLLLPLMAWFLLTNKVYSPQFSLWLLPLLALALPLHGTAAWAVFGAFSLTDLAVFLLRFPFLGGFLGFEPAPAYGWFAAAVVARAAVLGLIVAASVGVGLDGPRWRRRGGGLVLRGARRGRGRRRRRGRRGRAARQRGERR